jgi:hypothetical protein
MALSKGDEAIRRKIAHLVESEGKTPKQAAGQAFGMARQGSLGAPARRAAGRRPRKRGR